MAKYHGKDMRLYVGGYDISSIAAKLGISREVEMAQYAVADGVNAYHVLPGLSSDKLSLDGIFDDDYKAVLDTLLTASSGDQIVIPLGDTVGDQALAADAVRIAKYEWNAVVTDINRLVTDLVVDDKPWEACKILQAKATKTSDSNGTGLDNSAASLNGLVAYLQVFACGADDALIVTVESDDNANFTSATTLITFTTANGITTERKTLDWYDGGEDLAEALDSSETGVDVTDGTAFTAGQIIKVDDEQMYISSIASDTLTVIRGYNYTAAATHNISTDIYVKAVERYLRVSWSGTPTYSATFAVVIKRL